MEIIETNVLVIGGGLAGASAAATANEQGVEVAIVTKDMLCGGATITAEGGIAIPLHPEDSADSLFHDTIEAGRYLNDRSLVQILANRIIPSILKLEDMGVLLDRVKPDLYRVIKQSEGHTYPRAYLDRREALEISTSVRNFIWDSDIEVFEEEMVTKILTIKNRVIGATSLNIKNGQFKVFKADSVVLCCGGLGQLYEITTNPRPLTGDGFALAYSVGAELIDMEMTQFIPLAIAYPHSKRGQNIGMCSHFGPGVKLLNATGERYMKKYDPERMEFATRDIVARANYVEIQEGRGTPNRAIYVDATECNKEYLEMFRSSHPLLYRLMCKCYGEDKANWKEPFEATPSQHFQMGGVKIDEKCRTTVYGLFAAGEVVGGVHGANRLAGNGLTEALVFGMIAGENAAKHAQRCPGKAVNRKQVEAERKRIYSLLEAKSELGKDPEEIRRRLRRIMWNYVGPVRTETGLLTAKREILKMLRDELPHVNVSCCKSRYNLEWISALELPFMLTTALMIVNSALARKESRGAHFRKDYPFEDDSHWLGHITIRRSGDVMRTRMVSIR